MRPSPMISLLATAALCGSWSCGSDADEASSVGKRPAAASPVAAQLPALDSSFRALEDGDHLSPRDRWDPKYVAEMIGRDPYQLYTWVAANTDWIPYLGTLRGPVGVLMDRQGNSLDRALLLARLLETAGHSVRLAHGELTEEEAAAVLPALVAHMAVSSPPPAESELADSSGIQAIAAQYGLSPTAVSQSVRAQHEGVSRMRAELSARVRDQSARLLPALQPYDADADWSGRFAEAIGAVRDHWWVQVKEDTAWTDLDPLAYLVDTTLASLIPATETMPVDAVPTGLRHQLAVSVVAEQWSAGMLSERAILEHVLEPAELYGQPIVLQSWPGNWPTELNSDPGAQFGLRSAALEQRQWGIVLAVDDKPVAQVVLGDDGDVVEPPDGGGLGGLGSALGALAPRRQQSAREAAQRQLTAVWIEYELRSPGRPARKIRRAVFDALGPAARAAPAPARLELDETSRLTRSLALMIRTEILPITCRLAPDFVTHLTVQRLLANRQVLGMIARSDPSRGLPETDTLLAAAAPPVTPLYSLALARLEWSEVGDRVYVDRLGLLTRHRHPAVNGHGFGLRGAVDIAAGDLGVSLAEPDAYEVRLRQGVLDTNAEALWWTGTAVLNAGEAFAASRDWITVRPSERSQASSLNLPADAKARISSELEAGATVIAPRSPVDAGPEHFIGWWSIDPATGAARGVGGHGWGQCAPEYGVTLEAVVIHAARSFAFEYGLCQGLAQSINGFRTAGAELQARGLWFWWMPPIQSADPLELFKANNKTCLIGAMMGGFLATMPILLQVRRLQYLRAMAGARRFWRDQRGGIRFPPGRIPRPKPAIPRRPTPAGGIEAPVDPRGQTLPDYNVTQADRPPMPMEAPPAPTRPRPQNAAEAAENVRKAAAARDEAMKRSAEAAEDFVKYKANRPRPEADWPGDPANYDPKMADMLYEDWLNAHKATIEALNDFREAEQAENAFKNAAQDARAAERGRQGRGGFPQAQRPAPQPNQLPGCPPNCGNNNPTGPAGVVEMPPSSSGDQIAVGSSGVAGSSIPE
jgi:hypothetical protein